MPATSETREFASRPDTLTGLHEMLARFWTAVAAESGCVVPMRSQFAFSTAASEVAANIIRHSETESFQLSLSHGEGRIMKAQFLDRGVPYIAPGEPNTDIEVLAEGGFGLALVRRVVDELTYVRSDDGENRWTLSVRIPPTLVR